MWFTDTFYKNLFFRYSCNNCHFCNTERPSDITLADFWGWEKTNSEINKDDKGVSLVLINSEKGRMLWEAARKDLVVIPAKLEDCIQTRMQFPTPINKQRKKFEKDYLKYGFRYIIKKEYGESLIKRLKNKMCFYIKKRLWIER